MNITESDIKDVKEEEVVVKRYFVINGVKVIAGELYEVLGGLEGCSGPRRITIRSQKIADLLNDLDVANRNARGSYVEGPNFEEFFGLIEEKLFNY